jgi:hypothetical protein
MLAPTRGRRRRRDQTGIAARTARVSPERHTDTVTYSRDNDSLKVGAYNMHDDRIDNALAARIGWSRPAPSVSLDPHVRL